MDEQNRDNIVRTQSVFGDIARIVYLGGDNCRITEKNGFIGIDAVVEIADDGTEEEKSASDAPNVERGEKKDESDAKGAAKDGEEKDRAEKAPARRTEKLPDGRTHIIAERIFLARAFPFDMKSEYISVLDRDRKEIGMIRSLGDFSGDQRALLERELEVKYYTPVIKRIMSVKERYEMCIRDSGKGVVDEVRSRNGKRDLAEAVSAERHGEVRAAAPEGDLRRAVIQMCIRDRNYYDLVGFSGVHAAKRYAVVV